MNQTTNTTTTKQGYKTDKIRNTVYELERLDTRKYKISSDYSPYDSFSNCTLVEYEIRLSAKKGVIEQRYFSDLTGNQSTVDRKNKVFVSKTELEEIMDDIDRDFKAHDSEIINNDTMDDYVYEQFGTIEQLYKNGV